MISADGKRTKFLGKIQADYLAFSKNGKGLYGIQTGETEADQDRATLCSLDTATLKQKVIKNLRRFAPSSKFRPGIRFSLSPTARASSTAPPGTETTSGCCKATAMKLIPR